MCKRNLSLLLAALLAVSLLLTACGGTSDTESPSGSFDPSEPTVSSGGNLSTASSGKNAPTGSDGSTVSTVSTGSTAPSGSTKPSGSTDPTVSDGTSDPVSSEPFDPTVSTGSVGGNDPVPSDKADPARVRACFDDLLNGKLGSGEQVWIDASRVSTVRSAVLALDGPFLTADDVDRLACRVTLFLADEMREPLVLPAFRPFHILRLEPGRNGETIDANYRTLLFYTVYLFTPSDRFFRAAEIWTDLPSMFDEDRSLTIYCLALADGKTGSSPVEELYNGAPFVEVVFDVENGAAGSTAVDASQCTVVRVVRRGQTPKQLDAYSLFDDPTVRFPFLSWEEQRKILRIVTEKCLDWMYAGEEINPGKVFRFGTDEKAVDYLDNLPVPMFTLEQYETIVSKLLALGEGYETITCWGFAFFYCNVQGEGAVRQLTMNLLRALTPDAYAFHPADWRDGYYFAYCLPGDYRTPEEAKALIASGDVAYVWDKEDYSYPVLLVQGDKTTELFPAEVELPPRGTDSIWNP